MNYYVPNSLLSKNNAKTIKGEKIGWKTYIMYMSPFTQNSKGINVCSHATKGCSDACLFGSGFGGMFSTVEKGRINKTEYFLANRNAYLKQLYIEVAKVNAEAEMSDGKVCVRLNGTSDIRWEKFIIKDGKNIFELFPNLQFYDYTKNHFRFERELPKNYSLVFSRSETNETKAMDLLSKGVNVAVVFDEVPETYNGYPVVDGDENDLRFLDNKGVVIGLKYKKLTGKGVDNKVIMKSGFVVKIADVTESAKAA